MPLIIEGQDSGFTQIVLTGSFQDASGLPKSGTLTFTLTQAMTNGVTVTPEPIVATLVNGAFSIVLDANDDPETVPKGSQYGVTEQIAGSQPRDYFILISHAASPVDISTLMPGEQGWA